MKQFKHHIIALIFCLTAFVFFQGCSSMKKNSCGCPNKKGMVGY
jgi:hypothetical protein